MRRREKQKEGKRERHGSVRNSDRTYIGRKTNRRVEQERGKEGYERGGKTANWSVEIFKLFQTFLLFPFLQFQRSFPPYAIFTRISVDCEKRSHLFSRLKINLFVSLNLSTILWIKNYGFSESSLETNSRHLVSSSSFEKILFKF